MLKKVELFCPLKQWSREEKSKEKQQESDREADDNACEKTKVLRLMLRKHSEFKLPALYAFKLYPELRDFLVLPCKCKLQYITSSIDKDQVLRETFDEVQILQQKNVFLLVDEVQICPTVSFSGGVLSGPLLDQGYCLKTDSYYASQELYAILLKNSTDAGDLTLPALTTPQTFLPLVPQLQTCPASLTPLTALSHSPDAASVGCRAWRFVTQQIHRVHVGPLSWFRDIEKPAVAIAEHLLLSALQHAHAFIRSFPMGAFYSILNHMYIDLSRIWVSSHTNLGFLARIAAAFQISLDHILELESFFYNATSRLSETLEAATSYIRRFLEEFKEVVPDPKTMKSFFSIPSSSCFSTGPSQSAGGVLRCRPRRYQTLPPPPSWSQFLQIRVSPCSLWRYNLWGERGFCE
ncbi:hypothetical protein FHG87_013329 [Trinorchestia longiramus]|nr:hypothetical protein FHG87_013329 [Trinorchestia longiramus]